MSFTGGTGDVNPQWAILSATTSAANTTTTSTFNVPIQRLNNKGRAMILEILKVQWNAPVYDAIASATEALDAKVAYLTTSNFGVTPPANTNSRIVDLYIKERYGAFTAGGTYSQDENLLQLNDLTDGAGHGLLVATDNMFLQVGTTGYAGVATFVCKILYRWKNVGLTEYIGIVQSQQ